MASSTTMTACMPHRELMPILVKPTHASTLSSLSTFTNSTSLISTNKYVYLTRKAACWRFLARSSEDGSETTTTVTATATATDQSWEGEGESSSMEMPKGPPSLISALTVEKALRGIGYRQN